MAERLFSTYQVADLLGATPGAVVEWMQKGLLPFQKLPEGPLRVSEKALVQFLKDRGVDLPGILQRLAAEEKSGAAAPPTPETADLRPVPQVGRTGEAVHTPAALTAGPESANGDGQVRPAPPAAEPERPAEAARAEKIDLARRVLQQAIDRRASAVHVEPTPAGVRVRLRIAGALCDAAGLDAPLAPADAAQLIDSLRSMAHLPPSPAGPAQGRFEFQLGGRAVAVRVLDQPTIGGRRLVLHLADGQAASLEALQIPQSQRETVQAVLGLRSGLVIVSGIDRSARLGLLNAMAAELVAAGRQVAALAKTRDFDGLAGTLRTAIGPAGSAVDPLAGQSVGQWAWMLSELDSEAVLVADLADARTARAAFDAADSGLVLASVPAADEASALRLLLEMGLEGWPLSLSLRLVAATAAVRLLCPNCRTPDAQVPQGLRQFGVSGEPFPAYGARGCDQCGRTGYAGWSALLGLARIEGELAQALRAEDAEAITAVVRSAGSGLLQAGLAKVHAGLTSLDELARAMR